MKLATRRKTGLKNHLCFSIMIFLIFLLLIPFTSFAQVKKPAEKGVNKEAIQFVNQPIVDILLALAEVFEKSVVPDETVKGYASYHFTQVDFETNLKLFLHTYKMFYRKDGDVYYISRVNTEWNKEKKLLDLDAEDVAIPVIIKSVMGKMEGTIIFDPLPEENITLHLREIAVDKFLTVLLKRFPEYKIETDKDYYLVRRDKKEEDVNVNSDGTTTPIKKPVTGLKKQSGLYSVNQPRIRFKEFLADLFAQEGKEYTLFMTRDNVIEPFAYSGKTFKEMLRLLLEQANADYTVFNNVHYVFEIQQRDILKKLFTTVFMPLKYISVRDLPNLFPADLSTGRFYKMDLNRNAMILYGSIEEITPVQDFIKAIDLPTNMYQQYYRYDLAHSDARNIRAVLPVEFRTLDPVLIPNTNSFIVQLTTDQKDMFDEYIALIDRNDQATPVTLKYIQADELLKKLPPSIPKEKIIETPNPSLVFIKGTDATLKAFYKELEILDRPVPQVRYQLLVIQYQDGNSLSVNKDTKNITLGETTSMSFAGNIDSLFKVNFDIPSTLGWGFALELNASLNDKRAQIMADTTLVGISGQDVSFQNTETQRFRETTADNNNDDNDDSTSIIREIQTGLNFGVHGVASGDGMITMKVTADLTQGGSASGGDLPSTSTNKITTHVRALSGEVVQVGGLIRQDHSDEVNKIPLLGDIPLLGLLFQHKNETIQNSEVVIYVLPRVESQFNEEIELGIQLERLYNKFLYNSD